MRALTLALAALIVLIQYPLWLGKGSWLRVWEVDQQIRAQRDTNRSLQARNNALEAEVRDLKVGQEAIEERARSELGMIRQDEIFYQVVEAPQPARRSDPPKP
ncbi:MAG TPA: cell division protein FtsB [Burkholderiales bacterium]|nr:cell division protein FtsB [Burkholderiales bacterium]